jgi:hypothetical protein
MLAVATLPLDAPGRRGDYLQSFVRRLKPLGYQVHLVLWVDQHSQNLEPPGVERHLHLAKGNGYKEGDALGPCFIVRGAFSG